MRSIKLLAFLALGLAFSTLGYSQTTTIPCSNYTQKINIDSVNKGETTFRKLKFDFLSSSSANDSAYIKSSFFNKLAFTSEDIIAVKKNLIKNK